MGLPETTSTDSIFRKNIEGRLLDFESNDISQLSKFQSAKALIFRSIFNPVDYDGSLFKELKDSYKTNEIGFFITVSFFATLSWSMIVYRRS